MFFFGAFSGNLLYLVLAISSLAGCSAMVLRSSENQLKELKNTGGERAYILYDNGLSEISASFYTKISNQTHQQLPAVANLSSPIIPSPESHFIPPLLTGITSFSGSTIFSRPPPVSLVSTIFAA